MVKSEYPVIDTVATGNNIRMLREKSGLTVKDLQSYFGFEMPQAIYKWQRGESLPSVDNLYALGRLLKVPMEEIIVQTQPLHIRKERQERTCRSDRFLVRYSYFLSGRGILGSKMNCTMVRCSVFSRGSIVMSSTAKLSLSASNSPSLFTPDVSNHFL